MGNFYKRELQNGKSLSKEQLEIALSQMEKSICKIKIDKDIIGTGFFCEIPFPDKKKLLKVLITCNHVLKNENISRGNKIFFSLNNEKKTYSILIDNSRKICSNTQKDFTIIEMKEDDYKDRPISFLSIDKIFYNNNFN